MRLLALLLVSFLVEMLNVDVDIEVQGNDWVSAALILTLFQKWKSCPNSVSRGDLPAKSEFDTFYFGGEDKNEKMPILRARGRGGGRPMSKQMCFSTAGALVVIREPFKNFLADFFR